MIDLASIPKDGIVTFTGRVVRPLDPDPETFAIEDIAHSLSNQCRFTGHTREFYSVAQHAVLVSYYCDEKDALAGLLHDASEAYIADLARPIKHQPGFGSAYRKVEESISLAIGIRFGVFLTPLPPSVVEADNMLLNSEIHALMDFEPYDREIIPIHPWSPAYARAKFLLRFDSLTLTGDEMFDGPTFGEDV